MLVTLTLPLTHVKDEVKGVVAVTTPLTLVKNKVKYDRFTFCCGATEGSEQQHNQDLKEIYKGRRILEFITFYHNALHLTTLFTTMHCI